MMCVKYRPVWIVRVRQDYGGWRKVSKEYTTKQEALAHAKTLYLDPTHVQCVEEPEPTK